MYGYERNEEFWKHSISNETAYPVFAQCSSEQIISIVNEMIMIHIDPQYDEHDKGNPIIGNLVRSSTKGSLCELSMTLV